VTLDEAHSASAAPWTVIPDEAAHRYLSRWVVTYRSAPRQGYSYVAVYLMPESDGDLVVAHCGVDQGKVYYLVDGWTLAAYLSRYGFKLLCGRSCLPLGK
jgi:hypothetical protein